MSLFSSIAQTFKSSVPSLQTSGGEDQVIFFLLSLIPQQDQASPLLKQFEAAKQLSGLQKDLSFTALYFGFENFLNKNFASEDLRTTVVKKISTGNLPLSLKIIFANSQERPLLLFDLTTLLISQSIISSIGEKKFQEITLRIDFPQKSALAKLNANDLTQTYKTYYMKIFQGISLCLGPVPATEFFYRAYEAIKQHYPQEFSSLLLPILPPGVVKTS